MKKEKSAPIAELLERGYKEILKIDLQGNKKESLIVNSLAVILMVITVIIGNLIHKFDLFNISESIGDVIKVIVLFLVLSIVYVVGHELVHAAVMEQFGAKGNCFGYTGIYAYAGNKETAFAKMPYIAVALAPLILWGTFFGILAAIVPYKYFWLVWLMQMQNIGGAAGDLYVTYKMTRMKDDTGVNMTVYASGGKNLTQERNDI